MEKLNLTISNNICVLASQLYLFVTKYQLNTTSTFLTSKESYFNSIVTQTPQKTFSLTLDCILLNGNMRNSDWKEMNNWKLIREHMASYLLRR